jgi:hypothetical protein
MLPLSPIIFLSAARSLLGSRQACTGEVLDVETLASEVIAIHGASQKSHGLQSFMGQRHGVAPITGGGRNRSAGTGLGFGEAARFGAATMGIACSRDLSFGSDGVDGGPLSLRARLAAYSRARRSVGSAPFMSGDGRWVSSPRSASRRTLPMMEFFERVPPNRSAISEVESFLTTSVGDL